LSFTLDCDHHRAKKDEDEVMAQTEVKEARKRKVRRGVGRDRWRGEEMLASCVAKIVSLFQEQGERQISRL
jgi:hypothetical protein